MDVKIKFLGAAGTVTGSKYLLEVGESRILVDCGLFQGLKYLRLKNWDEFPIDPGSIDAVVLTHCHIDHSGYLPKLCQEGYSGPIYCTEATAELLEILLRDSAKLQEEDAARAKEKGYSKHENPKPLYTLKDAEKVFPLVRAVPFDKEVAVADRVSVTFRPAGHVLGAAMLSFRLIGLHTTKTILFSGDLGRNSDPLLPDPTQVQEADILLVESTYGNRNNPPNHPDRELEEIVNETFDRGGIVLVPAFAVGRTQMLLYYLKQLILAKRIPDCPVYIDSPMAVSATHLYKKYLLENENVQADEDLFDFPNFRYCASYEASSELQGVQQRAIIISASGMATGGRVVQHLYHRLPNPRNTILFAGYQAAGTRGRDLTEGRTEVKMFGELVPVKAKVQLLEGLSAHADRTELLQWLDQFKKAPKQTFVVHGEPDSAQALAQAIGEKNWNVSIPEYLESALLFRNI